MCGIPGVISVRMVHLSYRTILLVVSSGMATNVCGGGGGEGGDDVIEDKLYAGTAKSMEGVLADECYQHAKDEGCVSTQCGKMVIPSPPNQL